VTTSLDIDQEACFLLSFSTSMSNISASSPTSPWNLGYAALYNFPASLSLSSDHAIEDILADIPIFSLGLLSFGVFTFFFTMKRVSALSVVLYLTVFFAFTASIFDLSQILTRGRFNTDSGLGLNSVTGLIAAREIFYATSVGLRFLFFWLFVAEPPRGEIVKPTPFDPIANLFVREMHSGAWGRWGIPGLILKWALLAVTFAVGVLQIIWRVVPSANRFGPVYGADAAMEIVISALFVLKLLLNTLITPITPRSKTLRSYTTMIIALVINLSLGVGNIALFNSRIHRIHPRSFSVGRRDIYHYRLRSHILILRLHPQTYGHQRRPYF